MLARLNGKFTRASVLLAPALCREGSFLYYCIRENILLDMMYPGTDAKLATLHTPLPNIDSDLPMLWPKKGSIQISSCPNLHYQRNRMQYPHTQKDRALCWPKKGSIQISSCPETCIANETACNTLILRKIEPSAGRKKEASRYHRAQLCIANETACNTLILRKIEPSPYEL